MNQPAAPPSALPVSLSVNPRLSSWLKFSPQGEVTVSPGKAGLGTFAPPLDQAGNSIKGQLVARFLSHALGLDLFVSRPEA